jgi:small subunit ribosomal protein S17
MTELNRFKRKRRKGVVVSNKMQKTVTVRVERALCHAQYDKMVFRNKKLYAHCDDSKAIEIGQTVLVEETRPLSKLKRWRVIEVVK